MGLMKLYLVRHGAVVPPAKNAYYGDMDVPLSPEGEVEARRAGEFLANVALDAVYSSPLARAKYGAEKVAEFHQLEISTRANLREISRGRWMGLNAEEINERWPDDLQASQQDLEGWRGNCGESLGDLRNRVLQVRDELLAQHQGEIVVIVAHMMPIKALLAEALDLRLEQWPDIQLPTGSISLVDYSNGAGVVSWQAKKPTSVDTGP